MGLARFELEFPMVKLSNVNSGGMVSSGRGETVSMKDIEIIRGRARETRREGGGNEARGGGGGRGDGEERETKR